MKKRNLSRWIQSSVRSESLGKIRVLASVDPWRRTMYSAWSSSGSDCNGASSRDADTDVVVTSTGLDSFTGAEDAAGATAYHKSSPVDGEPRGEPETNDEATQRQVVAGDDPVCSSSA